MPLFFYFMSAIIFGWLTSKVARNREKLGFGHVPPEEIRIHDNLSVAFCVMFWGMFAIGLLFVLFDGLVVSDLWMWQRVDPNMADKTLSSLLLGVVTGTSLVLQILWVESGPVGWWARGKNGFWSIFNLLVVIAGMGQLNMQDLVSRINGVQVGNVRLDMNGKSGYNYDAVMTVNSLSPDISEREKLAIIDYRAERHIDVGRKWEIHLKQASKDKFRYYLMGERILPHISDLQDISSLFNRLFLGAVMQDLQKCFETRRVDTLLARESMHGFLRAYLAFHTDYMRNLAGVKPLQQGPMIDVFVTNYQFHSSIQECTDQLQNDQTLLTALRGTAAPKYYLSPYYAMSIAALYVAINDIDGALKYTNLVIRHFNAHKGALFRGNPVHEYVFMQRLIGVASYIAHTHQSEMWTINTFLYAKSQLQLFDAIYRLSEKRWFAACYEKEIEFLVQGPPSKPCARDLFTKGLSDEDVKQTHTMLINMIWVEFANLNSILSFAGLAKKRGLEYMWPGPYVDEKQVARMERLMKIRPEQFHSIYAGDDNSNQLRDSQTWSFRFFRASLIAYYIREAEKGFETGSDPMSRLKGKQNLDLALDHIRTFEKLTNKDRASRKLQWRRTSQDGVTNGLWTPVQAVDGRVRVYYQVWQNKKDARKLQERYRTTGS